MDVKLKPVNEQVIVITGASSGIGLATAKMASQRGARVVLTARDEEALREAVAAIEQQGGQAMYVVADVTNLDALRHVAQQAQERFGRFDTWINNAGVSIYGRLQEVPLDEARRLFDTNYWGVVHGSMVAVEHLSERGGAVINLGSAVSERAIPLQGYYSASKHAIKGYTEALRMELEKDGHPIAVTLVKPGSIDTPYTEHAQNYMEQEATLPPPVYDPDVVARAILACAEQPKREITVGAGGRMIEAMNMAPGLADAYMESSVFSGQQKDKPAKQNGHSLFEPSEPSGHRTGTYEGHVMQSSLYTQAALHPGLTLGLAAAAGAAVTALLTRLR